jgi:hypothetical protein
LVRKLLVTNSWFTNFWLTNSSFTNSWFPNSWFKNYSTTNFVLIHGMHDLSTKVKSPFLSSCEVSMSWVSFG